MNGSAPSVVDRIDRGETEWILRKRPGSDAGLSVMPEYRDKNGTSTWTRIVYVIALDIEAPRRQCERPPLRAAELTGITNDSSIWRLSGNLS